MERINLFHTPYDWDELMDWVNRHSKSERPHLLTAAAMGWNLAVATNESIQKEKSDGKSN
jgi:hypothetical protein